MDFSNCTINSKPIADAAWRQIDMVDQSSTPWRLPRHSAQTGRASRSPATRRRRRPGARMADAVPGHDRFALLQRRRLRQQQCGCSRGQQYGVGWSGTIYGTTDGGSAWASRSIRTHNTMNGVAFTSADDGWAVGGNSGASPHGIILATTTAVPTGTHSTPTPATTSWVSLCQRERRLGGRRRRSGVASSSPRPTVAPIGVCSTGFQSVPLQRVIRQLTRRVGSRGTRRHPLYHRWRH